MAGLSNGVHPVRNGVALPQFFLEGIELLIHIIPALSAAFSNGVNKQTYYNFL
jgi:hypothetical protein